MMRYAEVAVDAPVNHSRTFSYSIPDRFRIQPGQLVWVPFGRPG
jgi:primosomal protein N'